MPKRHLRLEVETAVPVKEPRPPAGRYNQRLCSSKLFGRISDIEKIASGKGIRERRQLSKLYGGRRWKKLKGMATVRLGDGTMCHAEVHWYEVPTAWRKGVQDQ